MREIKFRAWSKEFNKMIFQKDMNGSLENKEFLFSLNEEGVELLHYDEDYQAYVSSYAEIMQYIGLKDINGKEVYEGDMVEILNTTRYMNVIDKGVVKFENGMWTADGNDLYFTNIRVVGNIYENKDLLKSC